MTAPVETFPALSAETWLKHGFCQRVPGLNVLTDRENAFAQLKALHHEAVSQLGLGHRRLIRAEQIHGNHVVRVDSGTKSPVADCDGFVTDDPTVALAIATADCGPIYLADPVRRAIGLLHSGRKGSELEIVRVAISLMTQEFGTDPADLIVQLGPCIRPPHYEIDFPAQIAKSARIAGVTHFSDCGLCTAADEEHYYSYRREKGQTGRLLAILGYAG